MNLKELEALREKAQQGDAYSDAAIEGGWSVVMIGGVRAAFLTDRRDQHADTAASFAALHNAAPELFAAKRRLDALEEAIQWAKGMFTQEDLAALKDLLTRADQIEKERSK